MAEVDSRPQDPLDFNDPSTRNALKTMTQEATAPQTYFGRDFEFTSEKRRLAEGVVLASREILLPLIDANSAQWDELQRLIKEGDEKGVLLSFTNNEGTYVPSWCVEDASISSVIKSRSVEGKAQISVPSEIFHLFDWIKTVDALEKTVKTSDELLKGREASQLGVPLSRLSHLIIPNKQQTNS